MTQADVGALGRVFPVSVDTEVAPGSVEMAIYAEGYDDGLQDATVRYSGRIALGATLTLETSAKGLVKVEVDRAERNLLQDYARLTPEWHIDAERSAGDASHAELRSVRRRLRHAGRIQQARLDRPMASRSVSDLAQDAADHVRSASAPELSIQGEDAKFSIKVWLVAAFPFVLSLLAAGIFYVLMPHWLPVAALTAFVVGGVALDLFGGLVRRRLVG